MRKNRNFVLNGSLLISRYIRGNTPGAFGKIGGSEGKALQFFRAPIRRLVHYNRYLRYRKEVFLKSGVFPNNSATFTSFLHEYAEVALPGIDGLVFWRGAAEVQDRNALAPYALWMDWDSFTLAGMCELNSWYKDLKGKRILVITSFAETIRQQGAKMEKVWPQMPWMHHCADPQVLACPTYSHLSPPVDSHWKSALDRMCDEMETLDFDVCLIGAGAWSLPLAFKAKELGKIGIHMGGTLQLVYGIMGNRWVKTGELESVANASWTFPIQADSPSVRDKVEDNAYWESSD